MMWQPIQTAPESGYVVIGQRTGNGPERWAFTVAFMEYDEWVCRSSDRVWHPTIWAPMPAAEFNIPADDTKL